VSCDFTRLGVRCRVAPGQGVLDGLVRLAEDVDDVAGPGLQAARASLVTAQRRMTCWQQSWSFSAFRNSMQTTSRPSATASRPTA
jgi:hypothetical protein